ncbi:MAG: secretin N-terminal domain-containing protein [Pseudomonadota bacterium]
MPADETVTEIIPLRSRTVDEVLPLVRPLVAPEGTVNGISGQLIVRATPAKLAQLRQVLDAIDKPARQLVISVTQDVDLVRREREASFSGSVGGSDARVTVPPAGPRPREGVIVQSGSGDDFARGQAVERSRAETASGTQRLRVLEGNEAFVQAGQSRPVRERQVIDTPTGRRVIESTRYVDAGTGFYARPRMSGDRVTVTIRTARDRLTGDRRGSIETQSVETRVSARLGEWMEIGGIAEQTSRSSSSILQRGSVTGSEQRRVFLKVEEAR